MKSQRLHHRAQTKLRRMLLARSAQAAMRILWSEEMDVNFAIPVVTQVAAVNLLK